MGIDQSIKKNWIEIQKNTLCRSMPSGSRSRIMTSRR